jgi:hypothetical protein
MPEEVVGALVLEGGGEAAAAADIGLSTAAEASAAGSAFSAGAVGADAGLATAADASLAGSSLGAGTEAGTAAIGADTLNAGVSSDAGLSTAANASAAGSPLSGAVLDSPGVIPGIADAGASGAVSSPGSGGGGAFSTEEAGMASGTVPTPSEGFTTPPGTVTPADATPGMQGYLDKAVKYGPLALQGGNMLMNRGLAKKYSSQFADVGKTQRDVANSMVADAQAGRINPADQYAIDQWAQGAIAQAKQYYAKAGLSDSSMATSAIADINNRAAAMKEKARMDLLTTGMNALNQAREFNKAVPLTGLIVTKLDGTSKGGMVVAIQKELGLPIKFIGLGEQPDDLQPFDAKQFAQALFEE